MQPGDLLLALLANTAWAFNFIAGKAGVSHFQPFLFTSLRFAVPCYCYCYRFCTEFRVRWVVYWALPWCRAFCTSA